MSARRTVKKGNTMKLITVKDVSEIINVKSAAVYDWTYQNKIPYYKLNGVIRFDKDEILEWIKSNKSDNISLMQYQARSPKRRDKV